LNEAFLVTGGDDMPGRSRIISANGREGFVEATCLRPVLRGEDVRAWSSSGGDRALVWPHDADGRPFRTLPPLLAAWLGPYRRALLARSDARSAQRWWSVFRTDAARCDVDRVVWADIGRSPRATVLRAGDPTVPLNSCYVARCPDLDDAFALSTLLNSPLVSAWLSVVAEPARGGYRRYLGWTMSLLPIPTAWGAHRSALADLARRAAAAGGAVSDLELIDASVAAFGLRRRDVDPLLAWAAP
jgi:hypothetical protein